MNKGVGNIITEPCRGMNRVALPVEPPSRILLVPWGLVKSNGKGGDHLVDEESGRMVLDAFQEAGIDIVIDKEHASELEPSEMPDGMAPAMGWIKGIEVVPGEGIYGTNIEWTAEGAELIRDKKYRYTSWAGLLRKKDGRLMRITSVALTNRPAINMPPIVNKEIEMTLTPEIWNSVKTRLGLPVTAAEAEIIAELEKLLAQLRELAGVGEEADMTATTSALKARLKKIAKPASATNELSAPTVHPEIEILASSLKAANEKLAALESRETDRLAAERIASAVREGKLTAAMLAKDNKGANYFAALARDEDQWTAFIARQPVIAPPSGRVVAKPAAEATTRPRDVITAHRDRFDSERMDEYENISRYAAEHKLTFEQAMIACGAL